MSSKSNPISEWSTRIEQVLDRTLTEALTSSRLLEAARYSVLGGGKRLRPKLVYAGAMATGGTLENADPAAVAVELLHTYSLIHDDLPAMDDDALRRGQPTVHVAYDEATAILAGDALQALAFQVLAKPDARSDSMRVQQIHLLGEAVGFNGMALGQAVDLESEGAALGLEALEAMHGRKTGALITASILMGAATGQCSEDDWQALAHAGAAIGLAFQIQDDILDETASTDVLGKPQGRDRMLQKSTFPSLLGLTESRLRADALVKTAHRHLDQLTGDASALKQLATDAVERSH